MTQNRMQLVEALEGWLSCNAAMPLRDYLALDTDVQAALYVASRRVWLRRLEDLATAFGPLGVELLRAEEDAGDSYDDALVQQGVDEVVARLSNG